MISIGKSLFIINNMHLMYMKKYSTAKLLIWNYLHTKARVHSVNV